MYWGLCFFQVSTRSQKEQGSRECVYEGIMMLIRYGIKEDNKESEEINGIGAINLIGRKLLEWTY